MQSASALQPASPSPPTPPRHASGRRLLASVTDGVLDLRGQGVIHLTSPLVLNPGAPLTILGGGAGAGMPPSQQQQGEKWEGDAPGGGGGARRRQLLWPLVNLTSDPQGLVNNTIIECGLAGTALVVK